MLSPASDSPVSKATAPAPAPEPLDRAPQWERRPGATGISQPLWLQGGLASHRRPVKASLSLDRPRTAPAEAVGAIYPRPEPEMAKDPNAIVGIIATRTSPPMPKRVPPTLVARREPPSGLSTWTFVF